MVIRAALRLRVAQCIMALFSSPSLAIAVIVFSVSLIVYSVQKKQIWRARSLGRPLPPGPRPLPIVGNFIHIPKSAPWVGYRDLCTKYGAYYVGISRRLRSTSQQSDRRCALLPYARTGNDCSRQCSGSVRASREAVSELL